MSSMQSRRPSDGTFSRSVAAAGGRGIALIVAAVLVGALLLQQTKDDGARRGGVVAGGTATTAAAVTGTTAAQTATQTTAAAGATGETAVTAPSVTPGAVTRPLSEVRVLVVNGKSGIPNVAKETSDTITAAGYTNVLAPTNGPAHSQSTIYFAQGFDTDCDRLGAFVAQQRQEQLARTAITPTLVQEVPDAANADCVVVIGKPAAGATATTAA